MKDQDVERVGVFHINFETGDTYWSLQLRRILGVPYHVPASFELFLRSIHPDDRRELAAAAAKSFQANPPAYTALTLRTAHPSGSTRRVRMEAATVLRNSFSREAVRVVGLVVEVPSSPAPHIQPPARRDDDRLNLKQTDRRRVIAPGVKG